MKNFFYLICFALAFSSCASTRSGRSVVRHPEKPPASSEPVFLDNITINPSSAPRSSVHKPVTIRGNRDLPGSVLFSDIEKCSEVQFKYAILMEDEVENMTNPRLIAFLEDWYGTPYKYGGATKMGIDCSAFSSLMMDSVYHLDVPRTCRSQYDAGARVSKSQLSQGDLVFFNTTGRISHVGVYLGHNKFVHASTSSGIMISDLDESYFKRRYAGAARIR